MIKVMQGDVNERIREIPDGSVDLVCSSPPFLALRKYGKSDKEMGSEGNPAAFIDALLDLTAQFRRVLAPHGSIAIELGDTLSGSGGGGGDYLPGGLREGQPGFGGSAKAQREGNAAHWRSKNQRNRPRDTRDGREGTSTANTPRPEQPGGTGWPLKKSLAGVPHAYMLSLAYGWNVLDRQAPDSPAGQWRVRNIIVWARPNPPVGELADKVRPATSYITVACVSDKRWFDLDAVRHEHKGGPHSVGSAMVDGEPRGKSGGASNPGGAPPLDWWEDDDPTGHLTLIMPTQPYPGPHFAVWPITLAQRLIEMMCPQSVCMTCGEPRRRITERTEEYAAARATTGGFTAVDGPRDDNTGLHGSSRSKQLGKITSAENVTTGWTDCGHDNWRPGLVLDPFAGSGTTLAVAANCARDATGIELYEKNISLIANRLGLFYEGVS